jgi:hypothetical protein
MTDLSPAALKEAERRALLALARAYDTEEAAQMGEPSPWPKDGTPPTADLVEWVEERLGCAQAGIEAYRRAYAMTDLSPAALKEAARALVERQMGKGAPVWEEDIANAQAAIRAYLRASVPAQEEVDALCAEWEKAAEGVTPGPWDFAHISPPFTDLPGGVVSGRPLPEGGMTVVADIPPRTLHGTHGANTEWIARCSPDNILALLAALRSIAARAADLERECEASMQTIAEERARAEASEARVKELRAALEPFAEASRRFDEAAMLFAREVAPDTLQPITHFTHADLRKARRAITGASNAE